MSMFKKLIEKILGKSEVAKDSGSPYSQIIDSALVAAKKLPAAERLPSGNSQPGYVVKMCQDLLPLINSRRAEPVTMERLLLLESSCTGADYAHKFSLRCGFLAKGLL